MLKYLFSFLIFPFLLSAQINESDTLNIKANLSLTGFYQGGNVETLIFRAKSDFSFKPSKKMVFKTQNSYVYQEFGKEKADEDILSLNFLYLNPEKRLYPLALGFVSTNFRRRIEARYIAGAGVTYKILDKENNWLKAALTSEYENTNFLTTDFNESEYDGQNSINTFRGTFWVNGKYKLFKEKLILSHEFYVQPSLEESKNFRWRTDLAVELPIWKYVDFKINYIHTFESIVVQGQQREDNFLTFGFTIKSYE